MFPGAGKTPSKYRFPTNKSYEQSKHECTERLLVSLVMFATLANLVFHSFGTGDTTNRSQALCGASICSFQNSLRTSTAHCTERQDWKTSFNHLHHFCSNGFKIETFFHHPFHSPTAKNFSVRNRCRSAVEMLLRF